MCPLYPFHLVLLYLCLLLPLLLAVVEGSEELLQAVAGRGPPRLSFLPPEVDRLTAGEFKAVKLLCEDCPDPRELLDGFPDGLRLALMSDDPRVATVEHELWKEDKGMEEEDDGPKGAGEILLDLSELAASGEANGTSWTVPFKLHANFLGFAKVSAEVRTASPSSSSSPLVAARAQEPLKVSAVRFKTLESKLFAYSVAALISLAYVNMGCALDLDVVRQTVRRPVGPAIGFACQFVVMPLLSFALGQAVFDTAPMQLGLFVTGTSPGGGASNIWTLMFGGNLDLSVTMTAVSTFAAFGMMPLWIFSLGRVIFDESEIVIPYYKICTYAFCLVVPLSLGLLIARYLPRVSKFLVRVLKPLSLFLILFILIFGVYANLYMFKIMTWKVVLAGMGLPWLGFAFGCTLARICRRPIEDVIAIAIETGVQNTGMSIFILWFTLDHPMGDLAGESHVTLFMVPFCTGRHANFYTG